MNTVELDVRLEFRDSLRANYWFFFRRFRFVLIVFMIVPAYVLLLFAGQIQTGSEGSYWGIVIPLVMFAVLVSNPYLSARRQMKSNRSLNEPVHYVFSEGGIDATAPSFSSQISWANFYKVHETRSNFLLFISRSMMYVIPKRCFVDGSQMEQFRQLLRSQLPPKRAKISQSRQKTLDGADQQG